MKFLLVIIISVFSGLVGCDGTGTQGNNSYSQTSSSQVINASENDWFRWRGPNGNGIAPADQTPVTEWSVDTNVLWKSKVPGRGHASPTIVDDKIFLATADLKANTQTVLCYDRVDGQLNWKQQVNKGGLRRQIHRNNSLASSTISSDGERLFVVFENHNNVMLYVLDHDGKQLWKKTVCEYKPHFAFGFGASPLVHDNKVFVSGESQTGVLVAYDRVSGKEIWRIPRNVTSSYSSPIIATIDNREMLLLSGGKKVVALNPEDGKQIWSAKARWTVSCGTMVWDGNMVFASGGFPDSQTIAINATNGEIVWENRVKCYEQSLLAYDGFVYGVSDQKVAYCWQANDGKEMWKSRLKSSAGGISASPIYSNGKIYASVEEGVTFVIKANPMNFEIAATNKLGDSAFATPTIVDNKIYLRIAEGKQEWLYCIGKN